MAKFNVSVEKRMYATGVVEVDANSADEAQEKVEESINSGALEMSTVGWGEPEYEYGSFATTGDVD